MQLRPAPAPVLHLPRLSVVGPGCTASGNRNQGREMAIPVTKFKGLDPAYAGRHRDVELVGVAACKRGLAILPPHTVERLESRC
jgi:hypothetical protein